MRANKNKSKVGRIDQENKINPPFAVTGATGQPLTWRYEVAMHKEDEEEFFGIVEAYYEGEHFVGETENFIHPIGETLTELKSELEMMLRAVDGASGTVKF